MWFVKLTNGFPCGNLLIMWVFFSFNELISFLWSTKTKWIFFFHLYIYIFLAQKQCIFKHFMLQSKVLKGWLHGKNPTFLMLSSTISQMFRQTQKTLNFWFLGLTKTFSTFAAFPKTSFFSLYISIQLGDDWKDFCGIWTGCFYLCSIWFDKKKYFKKSLTNLVT